MKRRVVVTGMGIWSCIGQDLQTVTESLRQGRSGIIFDPQRIEYGLQSGLVGKVPCPDLKPLLSRRFRATMSEDAEYAYIAALQAFEQAGVDDKFLRANEVGCVFGGDGLMRPIDEALQIMHTGNDALMLGPNAYFRGQTSSAAINLGTIFHLRGGLINVGAACASSAHAIGIATTFLRQGMQDICLVGGASEVSAQMAIGVDALYALSVQNSNPQLASRPFDKERDGFVISGGAAALVLEEYEHAKARGANILAEVCGYGFSSNGIEDISAPSADAEYIAMKRALDDAGMQPSDIDYVNAHGTSTIAGDIEEAKALTRLFVPSSLSSLSSPSSLSSETSPSSLSRPFISSTKSMTGHENWMAGASEAVYSILMMQNNFVAPNINLENVIPEAKHLNIARKTIYTPINIVLSNSSGMGGTNSALVFRKI